MSLVIASAGLKLDLTSGVIGQYTSTTLGLAWALFVFCFVLALLVEAFGRSPAAPKDFGGVVFRALVVLMLLAFYGKLFGSLFGLAEGIAGRVAPREVWEQFTQAQSSWLNAVENSTKGGPMGASLGGALEGYFFDSLVALGLLLGQASLWLINTFGRVLAALLYVLGPLALVFSIPRSVDSGGRWFRVFVSVLCWPVLSGLLVSLSVSFGLQGSGGGQSAGEGSGRAFEAVALAGLMGVISFAVPVVASALVGGSLGAVSAGWASVAAWSAPATRLFSGFGQGAFGLAGAAGSSRSPGALEQALHPGSAQARRGGMPAAASLPAAADVAAGPSPLPSFMPSAGSLRRAPVAASVLPQSERPTQKVSPPPPPRARRVLPARPHSASQRSGS
jgi:hypothetical protein